MKTRVAVAGEVLTSEDFLSLSDGARACYVLLLAFANAAGLIGNAERIARAYDHAADEVRELVDGGFLIITSAGAYDAFAGVNGKYEKRFEKAIDATPGIQRGEIEFVGDRYRSGYRRVDKQLSTSCRAVGE